MPPDPVLVVELMVAPVDIVAPVEVPVPVDVPDIPVPTDCPVPDWLLEVVMPAPPAPPNPTLSSLQAALPTMTAIAQPPIHTLPPKEE